MKIVEKPEINLTMQAVISTSKSTSRHTSTIRKAFNAHRERVTAFTRDNLKHMVDMLHLNQLSISQLVALAFKTNP